MHWIVGASVPGLPKVLTRGREWWSRSSQPLGGMNWGCLQQELSKDTTQSYISFMSHETSNLYYLL